MRSKKLESFLLSFLVFGEGFGFFLLFTRFFAWVCFCLLAKTFVVQALFSSRE
jgi:hypothetical protein